MITGVRKFESSFRSHSTKISRNMWIPNETLVYLIRDWSLLDVWLYSMWKNLEFNSLYSMGIQRTGCWACPMNSMGNFKMMEETHPLLMKKLYEALEKWNGSKFTGAWVKSGQWRLRKNEFAKQPMGTEKTLCGDVVNKCVSSDNSFSIERIAEFLKVLGDVKVNPKTRTLRVDRDNYSTLIALSPERHEIRFNIPANNNSAKSFGQLVERQLKRAINCVACGVCVGLCKNRAIKLEDKKLRIADTCSHCMDCVRSECPSLDIRYAAQPYVNVVVEK
jgi:phosphoadenosine phosphosulfate reductase